MEFRPWRERRRPPPAPARNLQLGGEVPGTPPGLPKPVSSPGEASGVSNPPGSRALRVISAFQTAAARAIGFAAPPPFAFQRAAMGDGSTWLDADRGPTVERGENSE